MIFNKKDIHTFTSTKNENNNKQLITSKLDGPTGVFFNKVSDSTGNVIFFNVGAVNAKSEYVDTKSFDTKTIKSFFEAVSYFEKLIDDRKPKSKPELPSVGFFIYKKNESGMVVGLTQLPVIIDKKDIAEVFTPPKKKPYGRLNMTEVEGKDYDLIKGKYALRYDEEESERLSKEESVFAYAMTPYENSVDGPEGGGQTPKDVNDEKLSQKDIEGEDEKQLKGDDTDPDTKNNDDPGDDEPGEPGKEETGDDEPTDDEPGEPGKEETGDDEPKEPGEPGKEEKGDDEPGEPGEPGKPGKSGNDEPGDDDSLWSKPISGSDTKSKLDEALNVTDFVKSFPDEEIVMNVINSWPDSLLKSSFYEKFDIPKDYSTSKFKRELKEKIKPYFK